jgi:hypothetical protein
MEDDIISSLTREVKEEVIENYLTERRIVDLQVDDFRARVEEVRGHADRTGLRLTRMGHLMLHEEMIARLKRILGIAGQPFWEQHLERKFGRGVRFIRVTALRERVRFRKLVVEAYHRLVQWMENYRKVYEDLAIECRAVNLNIDAFQKKFDLLTLLGFLRSLDSSLLERKQFLGDNFTPEELASIDQKLYIAPIDFAKLQLPEPIAFPKPDAVEEQLAALAHDVFSKYQSEARVLLR